MEKYSAAARFQMTPETLIKLFDDKVALAHMQTKRFHILNKEAALIWKSICAGKTRSEIQQSICEQYDVDEFQVSEDIDRILSMLSFEKFISSAT